MGSISTPAAVSAASASLGDPGTSAVSTQAASSGAKMSASSTFKPPRTLILCFDGTASQYDGHNTNVVKIYALLKKDSTDQQLCYYQPGVGTYFQPGVVSPLFQWGAKVLDEAFAWYLDAHVRGGYQFLMQNYQAGDKICFFGFSRGAYTARALAGFLHKIGLLPKDNLEQLPLAYKLYKRTDSASIALAAGFKQTFCRDVKIEFVGVWETVASVGVVMSRTLPFTTANTTIKTFRHAVSLDEHRAKFRPNLYHRPAPDSTPSPSPVSSVQPPIPKIESPISMKSPGSIMSSGIADTPMRSMSQLQGDATLNRRNSRVLPFNLRRHKQRLQHKASRKRPFVGKNSLQAPQGEPTRNENDPAGDDVGLTDVKEVWFAGCHSDIGGGAVPNTTDHSLSDITLHWMLREVAATQSGLQFDNDALVRAKIPPGIFSRSGFPIETFMNPCKPPLVIHTGCPSASVKAKAKEVETRVSTGSSSSDGGNEQAPATINPNDNALQPIHDELKADPLWWLVELLPTDYTWQDGKGVWHRNWGFHLGRGRHIPDTNPLFHESVRRRMESALKYTPEAKWKKGTEIYVP